MHDVVSSHFLPVFNPWGVDAPDFGFGDRGRISRVVERFTSGHESNKHRACHVRPDDRRRRDAAATRAGASAPKTGLDAGDPKNGYKNYKVRKTAV